MEEMTESADIVLEEKRPKEKKEKTRDKILKAARQVFARYPYQAASIRMISKLGEVDPALISYHFGSKAELFKALLDGMLLQHLGSLDTWNKAVKPMRATRGLSVLLDYLLEEHRHRPELFRFVSLNFQQADPDNPIPGYDLIEGFITTSVKKMNELLELNMPDHEADTFVRAISILLVSCLGNADSYAKMMGMDPESIDYFNWVKDTVLFMALPRLKLMLTS
jgi:AcrR family transcriptional regulator